jgi:glycosyltransferase involved in cell wall biosynthesis
VIVVDDGSTDATRSEAMRFARDVRVISQANRGYGAPFNRGFAEARGDWLARCDADDLWEPHKLERQVEAIGAFPQIDIAVGAARVFGLADCPFGPSPGHGVLDPRSLAPTLYRGNILCSSTSLIRRAMFERVGPLIERQPTEDYDFWMRALGKGAVFYYDPAVLVRYRRHDGNVTNDLLRMQRATHLVHAQHAGQIDDRRLTGRVLARDTFNIGRFLVDEDQPLQARAAFAQSLRHRLSVHALAWALVLCVPERNRARLIESLVALKREGLPLLMAE